jgi:prephenate dehydrogenase
MAPDRPDVPFGSVALLGLGIMGGSLARALAALRSPPTVTGWTPDPGDRLAAWTEGVLAEVADGEQEVVSGADLVVLAAPLDATCSLVASIGPYLAPGAVVTDVASLKVPVRRSAVQAGLGGRWVGSHPMCGSARSGFSHSSADLFQGATVYLTADEEGSEAYERVSGLWRALGALPVHIDATSHDALMTGVSHLPQMAANALAEVLRARGVPPEALGPGGRDMTRLAMSSPEVWRDILRHAPSELADHLRDLAEEIGELAELVSTRDVDALTERMERTRGWRGGRR